MSDPTQDFLSAARLKITEPERDALIEVLDMLECGACKPFNMHDCTECVLGHAQHVGNDRMFGGLQSDGPNHDTGLRRLFFPDEDETYNADQSQAAAALRNYLTTGEPRWKEATRSPRRWRNG